MALITCQFVRPDRQLYEGQVASIVLVTQSGELGIWPGHSPIICALGEGVARLTLPAEQGGGVMRVIVAGGYAEVADNTVIVLADHARRTDDVEKDVVEATRAEAEGHLVSLDADDHRRAYYEAKMHWCDLLLKYGELS